jgi:predicted metal-dependent enzyme (double-stranded beta helix superfamily)
LAQVKKVEPYKNAPTSPPSTYISFRQNHSNNHIARLSLYPNESPFCPKGLEIHTQNVAKLNENIQALLQKPETSPQSQYEYLTKNIPNLMEQFNPEPYLPHDATQPLGYSKTPLYVKPNHFFTVQVFALSDHQKTHIHDHPHTCISYTAAVEKGIFTETLFQKTENGLMPTQIQPRQVGSLGVVGPAQELYQGQNHINDIHQLSFQGDQSQNQGKAVSVHFYFKIDGMTKGQQAAVRTIYPASMICPPVAVSSD